MATTIPAFGPLLMVDREPLKDFDFDDFYRDEQLEDDLDLDDPAWGGWNDENSQWTPYDPQNQPTTADAHAAPSVLNHQHRPSGVYPPPTIVTHEPEFPQRFTPGPTATKRKAGDTFDDAELSGRASKGKRVSRRESDGSGSPSSRDGSNRAESQQQMQQKSSNKGTGPEGRERDLTNINPIARPRPTPETASGSGQYCTIEVGSKKFRLSRASLASDSPSYFTDYFKKRRHGLGDQTNTLRLDGDPATFSLIVQHLQGLHIVPENEVQYARLFQYARDYRLPALLDHLYKSDIHVRIGPTHFQIPRELFKTPGDSTNYFRTFHSEFFSASELRRFETPLGSGNVRGPRIQPATLPHRDARLFAELLGLLAKQEVEIRSAAHRKELFKEAHFYKFGCLEQKLVPCDISYNTETAQTEILIPLQHIRKSGLSYRRDDWQASDETPRSARAMSSSTPDPHNSAVAIPTGPVMMTYARPLVDNHALANTLIIEIPNPEMTLQFPSPSSSMPADTDGTPVLHLRATFHKETLRFMVSLFKTISSKMGLSVTRPLGLMMLERSSGSGVGDQPLSPAASGISEDRVRVRLAEECYMEVDGQAVELATDPLTGRPGVRTSGQDDKWVWGGEREDREEEYRWIVRRGQWRVRVEPVSDGGQKKWEVVLCGVQVSAFTDQRNRNKGRGFLGG